MEQSSQPHRYSFPDDWFYRVELDEHTSYGGVRCFPPIEPSKLPPERLKDEALFRRLLLSIRDFEHANSAIAFIREEVDFNQSYRLADLRRFKCFETTLVVSYCRPFSESVGGIPRLSYRSLGVKLSPFVKALHEGLVDKRNKLFAHSDVGSVDYAQPFVIQNKTSTGDSFSTLFPPQFREGLLLEEAEFEQSSVLVSCALQAVMEMIQAMHVHFADQFSSRPRDASCR